MGMYQQEQAARYAEANRSNRKGLLIIVLVIAGIFVAFQLFGSGRGDIRAVQNTLHQPTGMAFGDMLDGYLSRTSWEMFTTASYMKVVEFTGTAPNGDRILIQFSDNHGLDGGAWSLVAMEINGRATSRGEAGNWLMNAAHFASVSR